MNWTSYGKLVNTVMNWIPYSKLVSVRALLTTRGYEHYHFIV